MIWSLDRDYSCKWWVFCMGAQGGEADASSKTPFWPKKKRSALLMCFGLCYIRDSRGDVSLEFWSLVVKSMIYIDFDLASMLHQSHYVQLILQIQVCMGPSCLVCKQPCTDDNDVHMYECIRGQILAVHWTLYYCTGVLYQFLFTWVTPLFLVSENDAYGELT